MSDRFPGYQNVISFNSPETILENHKHYLELRNATDEDCWIEMILEIPEHAFDRKRYGYRCTYQVHWKTYKGWKVYMNHTGCFASIPEYEDELSV